MFHPAFPGIEIPAHLFAHGFTTKDVYRHDACVRLTRGNLSLWVDHEDPERRENDCGRFCLHPHDEDLQCSGEWHEFEDLQALLAHLESLE